MDTETQATRQEPQVLSTDDELMSVIDEADKHLPEDDNPYVSEIVEEETQTLTETTQQKQTGTTPETIPTREQSQETNNTGEGGEVLPEGVRRNAGNDLVDAKGNIVDTQGKILATNGASRRVFEKNGRLEAVNGGLTRENQLLKEQLQVTQTINGLPTRYGLSNEETAKSLEIAHMMKTDPVNAAKQVLAMAMAEGYNISQIVGENVGDSVDMVAINQMINSKLEPLTNEQQARQNEINIDNQATQAYNQFVLQYPNVVHHETALSNLMQKGMTPEVAYLRLETFAAKHNLDITRPLGPQIEAVAKQQNNSQQQATQIPARQTKPMPNGATGALVQDTETANLAPADASWEEIIRGVVGPQQQQR